MKKEEEAVATQQRKQEEAINLAMPEFLWVFMCETRPNGHNSNITQILKSSRPYDNKAT